MRTVVFTHTLYTFQDLIAMNEAGEDEHGARDKVREQLAKWAVEYEWYDCTLELWKNALYQVGFPDAEISFTGFYSQGDGASFTCSNLDLEKLVRFLTDKIEPSETIDFDAKSNCELFLPWVKHKLDYRDVQSHLNYKRLLPLFDGYVTGYSIDSDSGCRYSHSRSCNLNFELDLPGESHKWNDEWKWRPKHKKVHNLFEYFEADIESLREDLCNIIYASLEAECEWVQSDEQLLDMALANDYEWDVYGDMQQNFEEGMHVPLLKTSSLEDELAKRRHKRRAIGKHKCST